MDQIKRLLESLNWKQILSLVLAAAAVIGGLAAFSRWNRERDFRPLYSSLGPEDAAAVLAKVRESGLEFRVSDNGSVVLAAGAGAALLLAMLFILRRVMRKKGPDGPTELPTELPAQKQVPPVTKKTAVLRQQAKIDSAGMAHVLRTWMAEPGDDTKRSSNSTPHVPGIRKAAILMIIL